MGLVPLPTTNSTQEAAYVEIDETHESTAAEETQTCASTGDSSESHELEEHKALNWAIDSDGEGVNPFSFLFQSRSWQ
jgi:hypothetical protein